MFNVKLSETSLKNIDEYISAYRNYFEEAFEDSGIWSKDTIIENYKDESEYRYFEILDIIQTKLSSDIITYPNNEALIRWRSKILIVSFYDDEGTRVITDLDIR